MYAGLRKLSGLTRRILSPTLLKARCSFSTGTRVRDEQRLDEKDRLFRDEFAVIKEHYGTFDSRVLRIDAMSPSQWTDL